MVKLFVYISFILLSNKVQNPQIDTLGFKINDKVEFLKSSVNTGDFQFVFQYLGVSLKSTKNASNDLNGKIGIIKKIISIKNPNTGQYDTYPVIKIDGFFLNYIADTKEAIRSKEIIIIH